MENLKELVSKVNHLNVLYVEDEVEVREESSRFFKRFFPKLQTANNGVEAWEMCQNNQFDLLITDLKMPLMNGHELIKKINEAKIDTITLLVSGISMHIDEDIQCDYQLGKPVNYNEFSNFLKDFIEKELS